MNISRNFLIIGAAYLLIGVGFGIYMGSTGDFSLKGVHAHVNLLGFTLMTLFGLAYRLIPALADNGLARAHFWLHQVGAGGTLLFLFLLLSGIAPQFAPLMPIFEALVAIGIVTWLVNLTKNA